MYAWYLDEQQDTDATAAGDLFWIYRELSWHGSSSANIWHGVTRRIPAADVKEAHACVMPRLLPDVITTATRENGIRFDLTTHSIAIELFSFGRESS